MKVLLVTGGCGFIGSRFIDFFLKHNSDYHIVNIDDLTYAADLRNTDVFKESDRYRFRKLNICNYNALDDLFTEFDFDGVIHFAAESHVDNSIHGPRVFIETNIMGTFNLLEVCRKYWGNNIKKRFHHVSTDEVYGSLGLEGAFSEASQYLPNSPYSASKASSDMLVRSYSKTYGMNTVITNCSNNYGPHQHREKLIPKTIINALTGRRVPIYGNGKNIRDWLFVDDHCEALTNVFFNGTLGNVYNIGGGDEVENIKLVSLVLLELQELAPSRTRYIDLIEFVEDRLGHDLRYSIDSTKISEELKWSPRTSLEKGIKTTIEWYLGRLND